MSEMRDLMHKEKEKQTSVFDTTKKSEYLPQEKINPYDMKGSIQAPPPVFKEKKNVKVNYPTEKMKDLKKFTEKILKLNIDDIYLEDDESMRKHEKKLVEVMKSVKDFDKMSKEYPDYFRELTAGNKKILGEKITRMRRMYEFCLLHNMRIEEDEILHYKQTERTQQTPPDKPQVDNYGPET